MDLKQRLKKHIELNNGIGSWKEYEGSILESDILEFLQKEIENPVNNLEYPEKIVVKLLHSKEEISGFGYSNLTTIFWWFHNKSTIVYHYKTNQIPLTQYINVPNSGTSEKYEISEYCEKNNTLTLTLKK